MRDGLQLALAAARLQLLATAIVSLVLVGCRVELVPGQGGRIAGSKGTTCPEADICSIAIDTTDFSEDLAAVPRPGWKFSHWKRRGNGLCGGATADSCTLDTTNFAAVPGLLDILSSDERFFLEPVFVPEQALVEQWSRVFAITNETAFCAYRGGGIPIEGRRYHATLTRYDNGLLRMQTLDGGFLDIANPLSREEYFWMPLADGSYLHRFRWEWEYEGEWRLARGSAIWQLDADATVLHTTSFSTRMQWPDLGGPGSPGIACEFETSASGHLDQFDP